MSLEEKELQNDEMVRQKIEELALNWANGKTSVRKITGLNSQELYAIASQGYYFFIQ